MGPAFSGVLGALILVGAATPSCKSGKGAPFVGSVSRSQYFEYHDQVDEPLCATLLSLLDDHAQRIGGKIGLVPDPERPFRYYRFREVAEFERSAPCSAESGGCASGDTVYSTEYFDAHEQAHNYVSRAWGGFSVALLNEGEAVALSCKPAYLAQPEYRPRDVLRDPDWRDLLAASTITLEGYMAGGFWMTHLAQRYGWDRARELHRRIRPGISAADFEREFADVYPISMDEAWSEALDTPGALPCENDWACISTPLDAGNSATPDCDGQMHRTITVADQPGVVLTLGGVDSEILLRECATTPTPIYQLPASLTARTTHAAALPPGTYTLFSSPAPSDVGFVSYLPSTFDSAACESTGGIVLDPVQTTFIDLLPENVNGWIAIAGGNSRYLVQPLNLRWIDAPGATEDPALCNSCDTAATCRTLPAGDLTAAVIPDGAVLRLQGVTAVAGSNPYGQVIFYPDASDGAAP
jgi:hypothetical protein